MKGSLRAFLCANDPAADIDDARADRVWSAVLSSVGTTPQQARAFRPATARRSLVFGRALLLGLAVLLLGAYVGRGLDGEKENLQQAQESAVPKVSVLAMANPWEGLMTEGE